MKRRRELTISTIRFAVADASARVFPEAELAPLGITYLSVTPEQTGPEGRAWLRLRGKPDLWVGDMKVGEGVISLRGKDTRRGRRLFQCGASPPAAATRSPRTKTPVLMIITARSSPDPTDEHEACAQAE